MLAFKAAEELSGHEQLCARLGLDPELFQSRYQPLLVQLGWPGQRWTEPAPNKKPSKPQGQKRPAQASTSPAKRPKATAVPQPAVPQPAAPAATTVQHVETETGLACPTARGGFSRFGADQCVEVQLPAPWAFMTRHHDSCRCSECTAKPKRSKGKVPGAGLAYPCLPGGVAAAVDKLPAGLRGRFPVGLLEEELARLKSTPKHERQEGFELLYRSERRGELTDLLWELEERTLAGVLTNGAHRASKQPGGKPIDWRDHAMLSQSRRKVGSTEEPEGSPLFARHGNELESVLGVEPVEGQAGQIRICPQAVGGPEQIELVEQAKRRWEAMRLVLKPMEDDRREKSRNKPGKPAASRADLKASRVLEAEYRFGLSKSLKDRPALQPVPDNLQPVEQLAADLYDKLEEGDAKLKKLVPVGALPGVQVGCEFNSKAQMAHIGVHNNPMAGMSPARVLSGRKSVPVIGALVMSGGYLDDIDFGEACMYTGCGENDNLHTKMQIGDQSFTQSHNKALAANCDLLVPVRVIRKREATLHESFVGEVYTYDGLYAVTTYFLEVGTSGYKVCKFRLERLHGQPKLTSQCVLAAKQDLHQRAGLLRGPDGKPLDLSMGLERRPIYVFDARPNSSSGPSAVKPSDGQLESIQQAISQLAPGAFIYTPRVLREQNVPQPCAACVESKEELAELNLAGIGLKQLPYDHYSKLYNAGALVYEDLASSDKQCSRVAEGVGALLEVFMTEDKGWGVRCLHTLAPGEFVCEFTGLIARHTEQYSDQMSKQQRKAAEEYCFDLQVSGEWPAELLDQSEQQADDEMKRDLPSRERTEQMIRHAGLDPTQPGWDQRYTLDARHCGNVARFINHSSSPNLFVQMVCSESHDLRQPHLCLFASARIPQFTELCYDYGEEYESAWLKN